MSKLFYRCLFLLALLCAGLVQAQVSTNHSPEVVRAHGEADLKTLTPSGRLHRDVLDQPVRAHYKAIALKDLLDVLCPPGWTVQFDMPSAEINPTLVFHAETSRRRALNQLLLKIGLEGIFYRHKKLILVSGGEQ